MHYCAGKRCCSHGITTTRERASSALQTFPCFAQPTDLAAEKWTKPGQVVDSNIKLTLHNVLLHLLQHDRFLTSNLRSVVTGTTLTDDAIGDWHTLAGTRYKEAVALWSMPLIVVVIFTLAIVTEGLRHLHMFFLLYQMYLKHFNIFHL